MSLGTLLAKAGELTQTGKFALSQITGNTEFENQSIQKDWVDTANDVMDDIKLPPVNYEATQKDKNFLVAFVLGAILLVWLIFKKKPQRRRRKKQNIPVARRRRVTRRKRR